VFPSSLPSSNDGCGPGIEVFPPRRGDAPAGHAGPTAATFATALARISAAGGTPTAATLQALAPRLRSLPGTTYVILATDGAPNCDPTASCGADQCQPNIESSPGCEPSGPSCCDPSFSTAYNGGLSCLDTEPTRDAVASLSSAGILVYVVGVPGSAPYAALLDSLATAGGTQRASEPLYYAVNSTDQADFAATLSKVAATITASCTLQLDQVPPDPTDVNVFLDEQVLAQAGADGWTLDGRTVTILGASCQRILDGDVLDVRVVAGCPTVLR